MYSYWWSTAVYQWIVPTMPARVPAAIRDSNDFADVLDRPMRVFRREMVAASVELRIHQEQKFLRMGHFAVGPAAQPNLVCLEYPYVQLKFLGEGASVSGKKTELTVAAPCRVNPDDREYLSDVPLPLSEIYRRPAQNQHFRVESSPMGVDMKIENAAGLWPTSWHLDRILFTREPFGEGDVVIPRQELMDRLGEPVILR